MALPVINEDICFIISLIFNTISIPIILLCTIALFYYYCKQHHEDNIATHMRNATLVCCVSIFIRAVVNLLADIERYGSHNVALLTIYVGIQVLLAIISRFCLYMVFIFRIYICFQKSVYAYSKKTMHTLFILLAIETFLMLVFMTVMVMEWFLLTVIIGSILFTMDTILSIAIVYLFIRKLNMIIKQRRIIDVMETSSKQNVASDSKTKEIELSSKVSKSVNTTNKSKNVDENKNSDVESFEFVDAVTRYTVLSAIAISTSVITYYLMIADPLTLLDSNVYNELLNGRLSIVKLVFWISIPIDNMSNVICLLLNNSFVVRIYKVCCKLCHNSCKKCFT
eukprot:288615_1